MTERFKLLTELGRGGMGVVWKARDEETGQIVALKLLHPVFAADPDYVTRFERELELEKRIHSANVVTVLGFGVRKKTPYLALEYVDGPSLRELLATHGPYSWAEARPLLAQIAQGLADAHAAGVIHRDLKPSNVLIGSDGVAKLADFGIAKGLDLTRVTGTSTLLGTPAYLAPEGPADERSDLYSLGVIAYELMAGSPPFEGRTYQEVILRHVREAPDMTKLPKDARQIVGRLLAKDPAKRPQHASEVVALLGQGAGAPPLQVALAPGRAPAASPAGGAPTEPPEQPIGLGAPSYRRPAVVGLGLLACLLLVASVALAGGFLSGTANPSRSPANTDGTSGARSVTPGQTLGARASDSTGAPTATPTRGQVRPATITFSGLGLDAAGSTGSTGSAGSSGSLGPDATSAATGTARTFTFTTDGAGPTTFAVTRISAGGTVKMCASVDQSPFTCQVGVAGRLPSFPKGQADSTPSEWVVTLIGYRTSAPTVDVTFTWPTSDPRITLTHGRFQGIGAPDALNGFTATFKPRTSGTLNVQASWTSVSADASMTLLKATTPPPATIDQRQYPGILYLDPAYTSGVDPADTYTVELRNMSTDSQLPDLTAQISFP
jgi:serine/threonine-protein kinase